MKSGKRILPPGLFQKRCRTHIYLLVAVVFFLLPVSGSGPPGLLKEALSDQADNADRAYRLYSVGNLTEAGEIYSRLLKSGVCTPDVLNNLCAIHYLLGELWQGEDVCKRALEVSNAIHTPHFNLALIYEKEKKYDLALEYFNKALKIKSDHFPSWFHLGNVYHFKRECTLSVDMYNKALEYKMGLDDKTIADVYYNLGISYNDCGQYEKAVAAYGKALGFGGENKANIYYNLGNACHKNKDHEKAIGWYLKAIAEDGKYLDAYNNLGIAYFDSGNNEKAIEIYKKALLIDPDNFEILNNLGLSYHHQGMHESDLLAYEYFKKAHDIKPENTEVLQSLAHVTEHTVNPEEAAFYYEDLLEIDPDNKKAQQALDKLIQEMESFKPHREKKIMTNAD